jgi:hypothetical protein
MQEEICLPVDNNVELKSILHHSGSQPDILFLKLLFHVTFSYTSTFSNTSSSSVIRTKIYVCVSDFP